MFKKIITIFLAISVILTTLVLSPASVFASMNKDEVYVPADGYKFLKATNGSPRYDESTTVLKGTHSEKIVKNSNWEYLYIEGMPQLKNGETYAISFWVNFPAETDNTEETYSVKYALRTGSTNGKFRTIKSGIQKGVWTKVEMVYTYEGNDPANEVIVFEMTGNAKTIFYVDDFAAHKLTLGADEKEVYSSGTWFAKGDYATRLKEETIVYEGSDAVRFYKSNTDGYFKIPDLPALEKGKTYRFSMWVMVPDEQGVTPVDGYTVNNTNATYNMYFRPYYNNGTSAGHHDGLPLVKTFPKGVWTYVENEYTYQGTDAVNDKVEWCVDGNAQTSFIVDYFTAVEVVSDPNEIVLLKGTGVNSDMANGGVSITRYEKQTDSLRGAYAWKMTNTADGSYYKLLENQLVAGKTYTFSAWVKALDMETAKFCVAAHMGSGAQWKMFLKDENGKDGVEINNQEWKYVTCDIKIPNELDLTNGSWIDFRAGSNGQSFLIDEILITEKTGLVYDSVKLTDKDGNPITITDGIGALTRGNITATVADFKNYTTTAQAPTVIIALYETEVATGKTSLKDVDIAKEALTSYDEVSGALTATIEVLEDTADTTYSVKVFMWDMNVMSPYVGQITLQ